LFLLSFFLILWAFVSHLCLLTKRKQITPVVFPAFADLHSLRKDQPININTKVVKKQDFKLFL
jgi:hypothetical protein